MFEAFLLVGNNSICQQPKLAALDIMCGLLPFMCKSTSGLSALFVEICPTSERCFIRIRSLAALSPFDPALSCLCRLQAVFRPRPQAAISAAGHRCAAAGGPSSWQLSRDCVAGLVSQKTASCKLQE